ncbi:hypothetical protein SEPCBS119000_001736 [Sporothrix epigloea]|uniref:Galactose oxidase/kelch, beta-propeller n=1 Tax=Sporothrix epigloea TaxID=1892477 RepID=A0ABP0DCB7_9PEZI
MAWTYTTAATSSAAAKWESSNVTLSSPQTGPCYLGGTTAFSNQIAPDLSNSTVYIYGGMCPTDGATTASSTTNTEVAGPSSIALPDWQSQATYSNQMLKLVPSSSTYKPSIVPSKGPPVAEAGFTFTPLFASQSNFSGAVTQSVNSVLLGGHTETAFVNLSTAAIWSLPEEVWSFISIANPVATGNTELATAEKATGLRTSAPESRSGHTAVLSEDGNSLVILGGWVGDVSQAADPQLAILQMGPDYGQWQWSIPTTQPSGLGIYGHGAALLPGNVMMVYGGYAINASSPSGELMRRASPGDSSLTFYNLTNLSWSADYVNPSYKVSSTLPSSSSSTTRTPKIGLGVGLGLGVPITVLILLLLARSCRQQYRERSRRHRAVRALAQDHQQFLHGHDEMIETSPGTLWGFGGETGFYTGGHDPYNTGRRSLGFETLRGARPDPAFLTYQSPKFGGNEEPCMPGPAFSSRSKSSRITDRGMYQPTSISDYKSFPATGGGSSAVAGSGTNGIHPIYEAEEEDDQAVVIKGTKQTSAENNSAGLTGWSVSPGTEDLADPFMTPSTQSMNTGFINPARPSMTNAATDCPIPAGQDRDVQDWVSGLEIEDLLFSSPATGANTAQTQQREKAPPINAGRGLCSVASKGSNPSRSSFLGAGAVATVAGATVGVADVRGAGEDETRTGSNLSDGSALSFLSEATTSRFRWGGTGINTIGADGKATSSDTSSASFDTAQSGFRSLRNDRSAHLHANPQSNDISNGGVFGTTSDNGRAINSSSSASGSGSIRRGVETIGGHYSGAASNFPPAGIYSSPTGYGGAASVLVAGSDDRNRHVDYGIDTLPGSPSKQKGRRTWVSSIMRIFSSSSPTNSDITSDATWDATKNSTGTGVQQGPSYRDMAHATLLRRKQGRSDWEADELREEENTAAGALRSGGHAASVGLSHGYNRSIGQSTGSGANGTSKSGNIEAGRRDGSGKSDDWDIEKAVQNRVVQVMFTMPRGEQLRVVNAEVEKDDEADVGSTTQSFDPQDYSANNDANHDDKDIMGGLSVPPPPHIQPRSYQSLQTRPPLRTAVTATIVPDEQYHALPPPSVPATTMPPASVERQDKQLQQLNEALAESRRLLSTKAIEPWMLDAQDYDFEGNATFKEEAVHEDATRSFSSEGRHGDLSWADASSVPRPLNMTMSPWRKETKEDRESVVATTAFVRNPMSGPMPTPKSAAVSGSLKPPFTLMAATPTTPTKSMSPVNSLAGTNKTPTKTISNDSLSISTSPSLKSRRSGRLRTPGLDTMPASAPAAEAASAIRKPAGFVLNMVDKFELTS